MRLLFGGVLTVVVAAILSGCQVPAASHSGGLSRAEASQRAAELRDVGRRLFADRSLSASGQIACVSCHDPDRAFGPPDGRAVQPGGVDGDQAGRRAVPSLRYLQAIPPFTRHFFAPAEEGNESVDNGPTGGLTWDGRVDRGRDQAWGPLLSPFEMADSTEAAVGDRLVRASYAGSLRQLAAQTSETVVSTALDALEAYEETPSVFAPYSSRFDAVLRGEAVLTPLEARGREIFEDPDRGNCAVCHPSRPDSRGLPPIFSDFGYAALGVPRNNAIPANRDGRYVDLGLCGPLRTDLAAETTYCGRFRTPTLRNVATRSVFFHNGVVHTLRDAVMFYATRDNHPERWFGRSTGAGEAGDLPAPYRANLETGPPFGRGPAGRPRLSAADVDAIVAFLRTLSDADVARTGLPASKRP